MTVKWYIPVLGIHFEWAKICFAVMQHGFEHFLQKVSSLICHSKHYTLTTFLQWLKKLIIFTSLHICLICFIYRKIFKPWLVPAVLQVFNKYLLPERILRGHEDAHRRLRKSVLSSLSLGLIVISLRQLLLLLNCDGLL